ncbi:MAG: hypothetical protein ACI4XM_08790 [Candidatus Coprovivens sp.]
MNFKNDLSIKMIAKVCFVFVLVLLFVGIMKGNLTYANLDNVYYYEDLHVGDFIPYGSTILTTVDYHGYCGNTYYNDGSSVEYTDGYLNYVYIAYKYTNLSYDKEFLLLNNSSHEVKTVYDFVSSYNPDFNDKYIGWVVYKIKAPYVYLEAVTDYSKINSTPSLDNAYTIDTSFVDSDGSLSKNSWYRITDINDYEINNNFWVKENDLFRFRNTGIYASGTSYALSFKFDAKAGDIISFDTRAGLGWRSSTDSYVIKLNGVTIPDPIGVDTSTPNVSQTNDLYVTTRLSVIDSGEQTLNFIYYNNGQVYEPNNYLLYTYGYVKNLFVMSLLNEGEQLDTSLVDDGDKIYYVSESDSGIILDQHLTYISPSSNEIVDDSSDDSNEFVQDEDKSVDNPITIDRIIFFFIVVFIGFISTYYVNKKYRFLK